MKRALVAALLSALATGAVLATVGFGANSTATTTKKKSSKAAQTTQSGPPKTLGEVYKEMETRRAAQEKKFADALGVTVDQLTTAQDKIFKDRLDAQVKANTLTQAQADAILACKAKPLTCDRTNLPAGGPGGRRGPHGKNESTYAADLAKALGIDKSKVESALKATRPARPAWPKGARPTGGGMPTGGGLPGGGPGGHRGHGGPGGPGGPGGGPGGPGGGPGFGYGASDAGTAAPTVSA